MPFTAEERRVAWLTYLNKQTEIIVSELNRFYTFEKVRHDPDVEECGRHFAEHGGAKAFFEKYGHLRKLQEEDVAVLSQEELKMMRNAYKLKLEEAINNPENMYYAGEALGHKPSFKEAAKHFFKNGCVAKFKQEYGHLLHPQDLIAETVADK